MHSIHTQQELLYSLARSGDPSAFYTLVVQFANAAYITERNSGKSHKEACAVLTPFIKKAYHNFITTIHQTPFDAWYRDFKKKYFHDTLDRSSPPAAQSETSFESIPMADIAHFGAILNILLQRQYGKYRRSPKKRILLHLSGQFHQLHWMMKTAFVFSLVAMALVAVLVFFALTHKQLMVTYLSGATSRTVVLPFPVSAVNIDPAPPSHPLGNTAGTRNLTALEKIRDTVIVHDTLRTGPKILHKTAPIGSNFSGDIGLSAQSNPSASMETGMAPASVAQPASKPASGARLAPPVNSLKSAAPSPPGTVKSAFDSLQ